MRAASLANAHKRTRRRLGARVCDVANLRRCVRCRRSPCMLNFSRCCRAAPTGSRRYSRQGCLRYSRCGALPRSAGCPACSSGVRLGFQFSDSLNAFLTDNNAAAHRAALQRRTAGLRPAACSHGPASQECSPSASARQLLRPAEPRSGAGPQAAVSTKFFNS